ncbi:regulator of chromosome condensation (RCC1) repeat-containing protein, putative [Babesia ovata]|uniref:Regulator of chromosome condensation (RCC1) repeat-containing protein, putative n=1 Tax=Babesia ovata TaxID=189622 RepID=A0A2H6KGX2_9APIC|nr:regulator of chromosome condensation (RCC1) repeat-containing protein, putative [Babesia ovata]GBE62243.1 regulator of chromosome condensation (RCC1) repeat-containing protein, putative [Babesia ovata]
MTRFLRVFKHLVTRTGACVACRAAARDANRWRCVTFGPSFGAAIDKEGAVYVWGQVEEGTFVEPLPLAAGGIVDCRCSATDLYMLGGNGNVCVLRDVKSALHNISANTTSKLPSVSGDSGNGSTTGTSSHDSGTVAQTQQAGEQTVEKTPLPAPERIEGLAGKRIVKISVGNDHAAFLADDGSLYCCGDNSFGQCGKKPLNVRNDYSLMVFQYSVVNPVEHIDLHKVRFKDPATSVVDVVCGGRHTCCVDSDGNVYTFGDDASVQLFLGDTRGRTLLELEHYKPYRARNGESNHSCTKYTQTDLHLQFNPIPVNQVGKLRECQYLMRGAATTLAAGDDFSIVAATPEEQGDRVTHLIASGGNRYGQCASADFRMHRPRVTRLSGVLLPRSFGCGSRHCMAALDNGQIVGWGSNQHRQLDPNSELTCNYDNNVQNAVFLCPQLRF